MTSKNSITKKVKPIILDNNEYSIACYARDHPNEFKELCKAIDNEQKGIESFDDGLTRVADDFNLSKRIVKQEDCMAWREFIEVDDVKEFIKLILNHSTDILKPVLKKELFHYITKLAGTKLI